MTSEHDLVQQHNLQRAVESGITVQPRWSWLNYQTDLQPSRQLINLSTIPLLTEAYSFKTGQNKSTSWCSNTFSSKSFLRCGSWTEVSLVLAGLHREGRTVKTGMLTLSCHCHAVHKVPWRSVTTHSSHLVEHVPVTLRVAVVRRHSPPAICPWYCSRMR